MKNIILKSFIICSFFVPINLLAHAVQVQYCVSCNGDLRIWVEHWHGNESTNSTSMTISLTVNGATTIQTSAPGGGVLNMVPGSLPGCSTPIIYVTGCPGEQNTYNDWVYYDFPGLPQDVPISFTIISGNNLFTQDDCGMFPLTENFSIPSPVNIADQNICDGNPTVAIAATSWTNSDPSIGLPASGTGNIPSFIPIGGPGTTATITVTNGCNTDTYNYNIIPLPVASFSVASINIITNTICLGSAFDFSNSSTITAPYTIIDYLWDFGDGNTSTILSPSHVYASEGTYNVSLTVTSNSGCTNVTNQQIIVSPLPVASFNVPDVCLHELSVFNNSSTITNGTITGWSWNFGDGSSSGLQNPSNNYSNDGVYNATLIVTTNSGCSNTVTNLVIINPIPSANFTLENICLYDSIYCNNLSSITTGNIDSYIWDFGDGQSSTIENPYHNYQNYGVYEVQLIVSALGCKDILQQNVQIHEAPVASFSVNNACLQNISAFNNTSTIVTDAISSYQWSFGDGIASVLETPVHTYTTNGDYDVSLVVTSNFGCTDTSIHTTTIYPLPQPNFEVANVCLENEVQFLNTSTILSGSVVSYVWDFGNGSNSSLEEPVFTYLDENIYNVTLIAYSNEGCENETILPVEIYPLPIANFESNKVCNLNETSFNEQTTVSNINTPNNIVFWNWSFGDGIGNTNLSSPEYIYLDPGSYTTKLVVETNHGCKDSIEKIVVVHPNPEVAFQLPTPSGCSPWCIEFTNTSSILSGAITSFSWDFGNGDFSTEHTPLHICYLNDELTPLYYDVKLTATSDKGCISTFLKSEAVEVFPLPIAQYTIEDDELIQVMNETTHFTNESVDAVLWEWSFGDGAKDTIAYNPSHTYLEYGNYQTELIVYNIYSCSDTVSHPLRVQPEYSIFAPNAFTPDNDGKNDFFALKGLNIEKVELLIFNRWGNLVFQETSNNPKWNGVGINNLVIQDAYVWKANVKFVEKTIKESFVGHVTLVK